MGLCAALAISHGVRKSGVRHAMARMVITVDFNCAGGVKNTQNTKLEIIEILQFPTVVAQFGGC